MGTTRSGLLCSANNHHRGSQSACDPPLLPLLGSHSLSHCKNSVYSFSVCDPRGHGMKGTCWFLGDKDIVVSCSWSHPSTSWAVIWSFGSQDDGGNDQRPEDSGKQSFIKEENSCWQSTFTPVTPTEPGGKLLQKAQDWRNQSKGVSYSKTNHSLPSVNRGSIHTVKYKWSEEK